MIGEITREVAHRPWPLPPGPWTMAQSWHDLLFAHWPIPADVMRVFVPPALQVDTFDGEAWIGVVPFHMRNVRPRLSPSVPWLSYFAELNVRTYVRSIDGARPGVYFFSLDAANPLAVAIARRFFKLPYFTAAMDVAHHGDVIDYRSRRIHAGAAPGAFIGHYRPTGPRYRSSAGTLEHWLTERYCLYTVDPAGRAYMAEIHHAPWPLQPAEADIAVNDITGASGLSLPATPPLLHFAQRLDVVVWPLHRLNRR